VEEREKELLGREKIAYGEVAHRYVISRSARTQQAAAKRQRCSALARSPPKLTRLPKKKMVCVHAHVCDVTHIGARAAFGLPSVTRCGTQTNEERLQAALKEQAAQAARAAKAPKRAAEPEPAASASPEESGDDDDRDAENGSDDASEQGESRRPRWGLLCALKTRERAPLAQRRARRARSTGRPVPMTTLSACTSSARSARGSAAVPPAHHAARTRARTGTAAGAAA
jgi:hypothetical protein